jgi:catechol 2,3-dioxygenase-like lactoylglutathione lyase family enzyme
VSTIEVRSEASSNDTTVARVDMKFEVVVIPVSDIDRAKKFYQRLGWRLDADYDNGDDFRVIQFTPSGSGARSSSARTSLRRRPALPRACT